MGGERVKEFIFRLYDGTVDCDGFVNVQGRLTGEEIIRCQDCRFRYQRLCYRVNSGEPLYIVKLEGFCSKGQRKEEQ